ncbi:hypothetical protein DPMN_070009 [Dreissena polymorpha]|uniref:Uncharacterized protein n=1 Tax=Dreissena polymorpha TaxID=45954 RepID=A0A9D4BUT9_DREPO|nr:hypothetical protein DPMN_070009 [Dreissena polymorpha]
MIGQKLKTAPPPPWQTCYSADRNHFGTQLNKNLTSRVFTRKTAPPTGGHVFQRTGTTFELDQHIIKANFWTNFELDPDIIGTNLLTNVYKPNVDDGRTDGRKTDKDRSQKLT